MNEDGKDKKVVESKKDDSNIEFNIKVSSRRDTRALAFQLLYAVDRSDYTCSLDQVIEKYKYGYDVDIESDSIAIKMAGGAIEMREELDAQINPLLQNWKISRLGCCTLLILRLALWELNQPDAIPSIVINEAIELAKSFAEKDAYKFVNGILDEYCVKKGLCQKEKEEVK